MIAKAYEQRLRQVAGFRHVVEPLPIRNTLGGLMYYLFFASQKLVAGDIILNIFRRHGRGGSSSWRDHHRSNGLKPPGIP